MDKHDNYGQRGRYEPARIIGGETEKQAEGLHLERDDEAHGSNGQQIGNARQNQRIQGLIHQAKRASYNYAPASSR